MQINVFIAAVIALLVMLVQANAYQHRIEILEIKAEAVATRASDIRYYNDCLSSSVVMSDVKSCISVHGH